MVMNLFAYLIIPIYTILFVRNTNWFTTNFSVISGFANRKNAFLLWGIIVGFYFYAALKRLISLLPQRKRQAVTMTFACVLLGLAVTTPYLPQKLPLQSILHVIFAFLASILLLLCLYMIIIAFYRINHTYYQTYLVALVAITAISALLLLAVGIVSSALEIFFTLSSCIFVNLLYRKVQNQPYKESGCRQTIF